MASINIGDLPDDELRDQLQQYGVNVGPITSSTRLFYEKKLGKLIGQGGVPQPETEESEEDEEEEEDEEVQINYRQPTVEPKPPRPQYTSTPVEPQRQYTPITQPRTATPTMAAQRRNVPGRTEAGTEGRNTEATGPVTSGAQRSGGGGGIGMWLKLLFLFFVAALVYLVIINMNPSASDKIPLSLDEHDG